MESPPSEPVLAAQPPLEAQPDDIEEIKLDNEREVQGPCIREAKIRPTCMPATRKRHKRKHSCRPRDSEEEYETKKSNKKRVKRRPKPRRGSTQANNVICKQLVPGEAYISRNVYKSIIRHIYTYTRAHQDHVRRILQRVGYTEPEISAALAEIDAYKSEDEPKEIERNCQARVEKMLEEKSIFTYILKATLGEMMEKWNLGSYGQLKERNYLTYSAVCAKIYQEVTKILR